MLSTIQKIKKNIPHDVFTSYELEQVFKGSHDRRYGLIKRAIKQEGLIKIKRGLYCLSKDFRRYAIHEFEFAQKIYGPSCLSLESALSYHRWIPEAVHVVTSICTKRAKKFKTPIGLFDYLKVPNRTLYVQCKRYSVGQSFVLIADPFKALVDCVFVYKKNWKGIHPLLKSLRVENEFLSSIHSEQLDILDKAYQSRRVSSFLKAVRKDLNL